MNTCTNLNDDFLPNWTLDTIQGDFAKPGLLPIFALLKF